VTGVHVTGVRVNKFVMLWECDWCEGDVQTLAGRQWGSACHLANTDRIT